MPHFDYSMFASDPTLGPDGHWEWTLTSNQIVLHRPFATERDARHHRERTFKRLLARARRLGGWTWRTTHTAWHVALPDGIDCDAPVLCAPPMSVHLE